MGFAPITIKPARLPRLALGGAGIVSALFAMPALADVIEIGAEGHSWKVGGPPPQQGQYTPPPGVDGEDFEAALAQVPMTVPEFYRAHVAGLAIRYQLSPSLIDALVWQESRWRHEAVSPVGARGLAQLMPGTARDMGVDIHDPFQNLEGGARYLRIQLNRFEGNLALALAAYNCGPERVARVNGIPAIRETQLYVASIMGRLAAQSRS
ncbi:MAG: lytic transglycosylase domain-containing protein [Sphingomonadaceae bacterium]